MKLAVVGSRTFNNYALLKKALDEYYGKDIELIISGGAKGADSFAERYAEENKIETLIFLPNRKKYEGGAYFKRNKKIIKACDHLVAFWDGESPGTEMSIKLAHDFDKGVRLVKI